MPLPLVWSDAADSILRRLRAEGATWDEIAAVFRLNRSTVIARAHRIGAKPPPPDHAKPPPDLGRPPLPPGHPASWQALTAGTLLAGAAYGPELSAALDELPRCRAATSAAEHPR